MVLISNNEFYRLMKKIAFLFVGLFSTCYLFSQQIPTFSLYSLNHYAINPAATGITDKIPVTLSYRKLWAGFNNSPSVQYLSGDMEVYPSMGAGLKFFNFQAGPQRKTGAELTYSYHLKLNEDTKLSFGLSGLFYQFYLDKSKLTFELAGDKVLNGTDKMFVPDASFGMYLYNDRYYAGISVPQLFNRNIDLKTNNILQEKQVRHYYILGGYNYDVNRDLSIDPSFLFKFVGAGLYQIDIGARAVYKDMLAFGLSFRSGDAVVIQVGYTYQSFTIGYSYDIVINGLNVSTFGSQEIVLRYAFDNFLKH